MAIPLFHDVIGVVDLDSAMASILAQCGVREFAHLFLMRQQPPVNTADLSLNIEGSPGDLFTLALHPDSFFEENALPAEPRLLFRGAVSVAWRLCEDSLKNRNITSDDAMPGLLDAPIDLARRPRMLERFSGLYKFQIPDAFGRPAGG